MRMTTLILSCAALTACAPAPSSVDRYQTMLEGTPVEITIDGNQAEALILPSAANPQLFRTAVLAELEIAQRAQCEAVTRHETNVDTMRVTYTLQGCLG